MTIHRPLLPLVFLVTLMISMQAYGQAATMVVSGRTFYVNVISRVDVSDQRVTERINFTESSWDLFIDLEATAAAGPSVKDFGKVPGFTASGLTTLAFTNAVVQTTGSAPFVLYFRADGSDALVSGADLHAGSAYIMETVTWYQVGVLARTEMSFSEPWFGTNYSMVMESTHNSTHLICPKEFMLFEIIGEALPVVPPITEL